MDSENRFPIVWLEKIFPNSRLKLEIGESILRNKNKQRLTFHMFTTRKRSICQSFCPQWGCVSQHALGQRGFRQEAMERGVDRWDVDTGVWKGSVNRGCVDRRCGQGYVCNTCVIHNLSLSPRASPKYVISTKIQHALKDYPFHQTWYSLHENVLVNNLLKTSWILTDHWNGLNSITGDKVPG